MQISDANLRNMLNKISEGNHVLNERVKLYKNQKSDCPDCSYDPIRKESTDYNCDTCGGIGFVITEIYEEIDASVETEEDFANDITKAGRITEGQIFVTIDIKEIVDYLNVNNKFDLNDHNELQACIDQYDYIVWKGAKYHVDKFSPGWLQGSLYEIGLMMSLINE